ncbi:RNA demethylase ALKBH9B-like [Tripterygium wilfordii]|uniref:RNA demethylase ALKBH9B-like n=1 Tax=Tripterygium wilfordii TaxID=458696 RepID=UPI0018F7FA92|nr:RNA demethylase ALKBH9B-like [Tripterygium wilfordii]
MSVTGDLDQVRKEDPFLMHYQPSDLRVASEFLTRWRPFLSRDLCHMCNQIFSDRIRSLDPEVDGEAEALHSDKSLTSLSRNDEESEETKENSEDNCDTHSQGSCRDGDDTNSLGSAKDRANGCCEPHLEASSSGLTSVSPFVDTTLSPRISWADMAQEDELEEDEEEESELNKRVVNMSPLSGDLTVTKVIEKPKLSRDQREYIRFMNVKRKKDFICLERVKGKIVNILQGLELHNGVFSAAEQKRIVEQIYALEEKGKRGELKERTYSTPKKWMRGKGGVTMQFGCCYNYATDKMGNPPGILQKETVDPLPSLFKVIVRRLIMWHVLPPSCVPDSCIVNIYEEGNCIPPHVDNHDFVRPFCTVSFLGECNIVFGSNLKILDAGEFAGSIAIPLPVGSVLVLNGNGADVAKHCVPAVSTKRISITFRKMDESKRPIGFVPEPDLQGIRPLSYETDEVKRFDSPKSDSRIKRQPFRREGEVKGRGHSQRSYAQSEPHYSTRTRQGPIYKGRSRMNPDN